MHGLTPGTWHFRFYLPPSTSLGLHYCVSVTVIHQVGLDTIRIVNCMFLPSAKFDVKKMLITWSEEDRTPCIALMLVQLISTAVDGTTRALHSV